MDGWVDGWWTDGWVDEWVREEGEAADCEVL